MKKYFIAAAVCIAATAGLLAVPDFFMKSVPTARSVQIQKIEHTDILEITGNIVKNASDGKMSVVAYVSEKDISLVREGQYAEITGDAFPDCVYTGLVSRIADNATVQQKSGVPRTYVEIKISIDNPDDNLKAGYTAVAALQTSESELLTVVPYESVGQDSGGEYVFVLKENTAVKKYITTGREFSEGVEVISGISATDRVINVRDESDEGKTVFLED